MGGDLMDVLSYALSKKYTNEQIKEVRESIASGIEAINKEVENTTARQDNVEAQFQAVLDETTDKDVISAPEITAARVGADNTTHSNLKARLDTEHQQVMSHLAETESKLDLNNWELQNKTRTQKPMLTIVDDDGHKDVINLLLPLAESLDFKFTATVPGFYMLPDGPASHMKKDDLLLLQSLGHEISSHTYGHIRLDEKTEEELIVDFEQMKSLMEEWGIKCTTLCYPFGARNDLAIDVARRYFRGARSTDYGINYSPLETWDLRVINGYRADEPTDNVGKIALYKTDIDELVANNGWGIYSAHLYLNNTQVEIISEIVQYAKSLGVEIVTLNEGFNRMGNIIDVGRYVKDNLSKPHYVVGVNGEVVGDKTQNLTRYTRGEKITSVTPPSYFELGKLHKTRVRYSERAGFPENNGGTLTTDAVTAISYNSYIVQYYEPLESKNSYKRHAIDNDTWSAWERTNSEFDLVVKIETNAVTSASPVTDFPDNKISYCQITYGNRTGFPPSGGGILMTNRILNNDAYAYQEYDCLGSHNKYKRYWDGDAWSDWKQISMV